MEDKCCVQTWNGIVQNKALKNIIDMQRLTELNAYEKRKTNTSPNTSYERGRSLPRESIRFEPNFKIKLASCALYKKILLENKT